MPSKHMGVNEADHVSINPDIDGGLS